MRAKKLGKVALTLAGITLCAGLALAQQGDRRGRRDAPQDPPMQRGQWAGQQRPMDQGQRRSPLDMLLAADGVTVDVKNRDAGVDLVISLGQAEAVERLQQRVGALVDRVGEMAGRAGDRRRPEQRQPRGGREGGPQQPGMAGGGRGDRLMALLATGAVQLASQNTDDGVVLSFRSETPDIVEALQQALPQAVERARTQRGQAGDRDAMRKALGVLALEGVVLNVKETDSGISVTINSKDPEAAKAIKANLPAYFEQLQAMAQRMKRAREGRRRPGADQGAPRMRDDGPPRDRQAGPARRRGSGGRFGPPPPPED